MPQYTSDFQLIFLVYPWQGPYLGWSFCQIWAREPLAGGDHSFPLFFFFSFVFFFFSPTGFHGTQSISQGVGMDELTNLRARYATEIVRQSKSVPRYFLLCSR